MQSKETHAPPIAGYIVFGCLAAILFGLVQYALLFHGPVVPFRHNPAEGLPAWFVDDRRIAWLRAGLPLTLLLGFTVSVLSRHLRATGGEDVGGATAIGMPIVSAGFAIFPVPAVFSLTVPLMVAAGGLVAAGVLVFRRRLAFAAATAVLNLSVSFVALIYAANVFDLGSD